MNTKEECVMAIPPVREDRMYQLLCRPSGDRHKDSTLDPLASDPSVPLLVLTGGLWNEIRHLVRISPAEEMAAFLVLTRIDANRPHFMATDIFMPKQVVSAAGVTLDVDDCERAFKEAEPLTGGLQRRLCHIHSHGAMGTFWSGTDDTQQLTREDLGFLDDWRFYVVVNSKDSVKASFVQYEPVLFRTDAAVAVSYAYPEPSLPLTAARRKELDAMYAAAVTRKVVVQAPAVATQWKAPSLGSTALHDDGWVPWDMKAAPAAPAKAVIDDRFDMSVGIGALRQLKAFLVMSVGMGGAPGIDVNRLSSFYDGFMRVVGEVDMRGCSAAEVDVELGRIAWSLLSCAPDSRIADLRRAEEFLGMLGEYAGSCALAISRARWRSGEIVSEPDSRLEDMLRRWDGRKPEGADAMLVADVTDMVEDFDSLITLEME